MKIQAACPYIFLLMALPVPCAAQVTAPGDLIDARNYGVSMKGSVQDAQYLQTLYADLPDQSTINLPAGLWPLWWSPTHIAGKHIHWHDLGPVSYPGFPPQGGINCIGDGDVHSSFFNGSIQGSKCIGQESDYAPVLNLVLDVHHQYPVTAWGGRDDVAALNINATGESDAAASTVGLTSHLYSLGKNTYSTNDVALKTYTDVYGWDSTWGIDIRSTDHTGTLPRNDGTSPGAFSLIGMEVDLLANGPDNPETRYNATSAAYRQFIYLGGGTNEPLGHWAAGVSTYRPGDVIKAMDDHGTMSMFIVTHAGLSGLHPPAWQQGATDIIDGSVHWKWGEPYATSIGNGIYLQKGDQGSYGSFLSTNGHFLNAAMDVSEMTCQTTASCAAIRIPPDIPIDLSANGTAAGQNRHTLRYEDHGRQLEYRNRGQVVFSIADDGSIAAGGGARLDHDKIRTDGQGNIQARGMVLTDLFKLPHMGTTRILAWPHPEEGAIINDSDRHAPAIYENGHWYYMELHQLEK